MEVYTIICPNCKKPREVKSRQIYLRSLREKRLCLSCARKRYLDNYIRTKKDLPSNPNAIFYWPGKEMDQWIDDFNKSTDQEFRNRLFEDKLYEPFRKLCECVHNKFEFVYIPESYEDRQSELLGHLIQHIHQYDITKGRSFSYFSFIAKNWLIAQNQKFFKLKDKMIEYPVEDGDMEIRSKERLMSEAIEEEERKVKALKVAKELLSEVVKYIQNNMDELFKKEQEKYVVRHFIAMIDEFEWLEEMPFKKKFLLEMRNRTGLNCVKMRTALDKIRAVYKTVRKAYLGDCERIPMPNFNDCMYWKNFKEWESYRNKTKNYRARQLETHRQDRIYHNTKRWEKNKNNLRTYLNQ